MPNPTPSHPAAHRTTFQVDGMTCNNCARHVAEALREVGGVRTATVSLDSGTATVEWEGESAGQIKKAIDAVAEAGYKAEVAESEAKTTSGWSPFAGWKFNAIVGSVCTLVLIIGDWGLGLGMSTPFRWVAFALGSIVQFLCGAKFYRGAWNQAKIGGSNMDTLVSLGSTTAYVFSVWALFSGSQAHLYFLEASGIITFVSIGHWLEARASAKASSALRGLLNLAPQTAHRRGADGRESSVPVSELRIDNVVVLRPGDRVPTDGVVVRGDSTINEAMLTGEALPVTKKENDQVFAGTVNLDGQIDMRVTATGEQTALAQIVAAVQRAQDSRAEIQRLADRVSNVFVPIVVVCAVVTGLWWGLFFPQAQSLKGLLFGGLHLHHSPDTALSAAFIYAAAVLIVACPCAMGLATPIAIMAGTNAAASRGILIRDGIALEKAGQITAVIFDKTGTLTVGHPTVAHTQIIDKSSPLDPAALASALAAGSRHPLSRAIAALKQQNIALQGWQEIRGSGIEARLTDSDAVVRLGSLTWLAQQNVQNSEGKNADTWMEQGYTVVGLSVDNKVIALFALQDALKTGAADVVGQLQSQNLKVYVVTGDNARTARALARQAGIADENVSAGIRPENKAEFVKKLQREGIAVAFVGDGINDAPALEQADLGIAVAKASDIATEAADIILLKSDIHAIPETLGLAEATLRTIKQNLFWAFFYNAASIPLAALGLLGPMLCAAAMGLSDLVVIGNALRLRRWKMR